MSRESGDRLPALAAGQVREYASRCGCAADEWLARREAGDLYCGACAAWKPAGRFPPSGERCRQCRATYMRKRRAQRTPQQEAADRERDNQQQRARRARAREQERHEAVLARARRVISTAVDDDHPPLKVRLRLAAARSAGLPFTAAWEASVGHLGAEWSEVLESTRSAWQAAYERAAAAALDRLAAIEGGSGEDDFERLTGPLAGSAVSS